MNTVPRSIVGPIVLAVTLGCEQVATAPPDHGPLPDASPSVPRSFSTIPTNAPRSMCEPGDPTQYTVALTTGGDTYFTSGDCSGQAYAVDGYCTGEPYRTALATFGCAMDFSACQDSLDMYSYYLHGDPDRCRAFNPDGSDFVPVIYNASWTCCNDGQCSGSTPHCQPGQHQCVECYSDAHCSGGTPYCNTTSYVCVECTSSDQCDTGYQCSGGFCVCTPDPTCNSRSCSQSSDCNNGTCPDGVCRFGTCMCPTKPIRVEEGG